MLWTPLLASLVTGCTRIKNILVEHQQLTFRVDVVLEYTLNEQAYFKIHLY